ncbi:uncharacterized protein DSM5745_10458 [Aspergillus mulundensis]|uniref:Uncharacterized protein n=1 Tax=Aspergillus mulundensis TaxID=1810919 RepID=A0A3D8QIY6_9EURO|nr:hypothetical protein DSM5745_10458 [Aspergillus mulundensis]RDW61786.1 hypothetical protein DSM5745_10458 [Aspergillus mulundensis]
MQDPWPYPLTFADADPALTNTVEACKAEIMHILTTHGFPTKHHYIWIGLTEITKPEYPNADEENPRTVLKISFVEAPYVPDRLRIDQARDAVAELLAKKGIANIQKVNDTGVNVDVEIVSEICAGAHQQEIMQLVNHTLCNNWCMFWLGLVKHKSNPTIVIYVKPFTIADWSGLARKIKQLLPQDSAVSRDMKVDFLPGILSPPEHTRSEKGVYLDGRMRADGMPTPGTSIAVQGHLERPTGTLGPFVTLTRGDKTWRCALTSQRALGLQLAHKAAGNSGPATNETTSKAGAETKYNILSFAPKDVEQTKEMARDTLRFLKKALHDAEAKQPVKEGHIASLKERVAEAELKKTALDKMPVKLGRVLLSSSSCQISPKARAERANTGRKRVQDWALLELNPEPFNNNKLNYFTTMPRLYPRDTPFNPVTDGPASLLLRPGQPLDDEFGHLSGGKWYFKMGRPTNITSGICNGVPAYVN